MCRSCDEKLETLQQVMISGMYSLIEASQRKQQGLPVRDPDPRGAMHTAVREMIENEAWHIDGAWIEALLSMRITYADCDEIRQRARANVEAVLDRQEMPWKRQR